MSGHQIDYIWQVPPPRSAASNQDCRFHGIDDSRGKSLSKPSQSVTAERLGNWIRPPVKIVVGYASQLLNPFGRATRVHVSMNP